MAIDNTISTTTTTVSRPSPAASVGLLLARLPLGLLFILAGIFKFVYFKGGVPAFVDANLANASKIMGESGGRTFLGALPYAEIALGAFLVMGVATRVVAACMALLLLGITITTTGIHGDPLPFHPNLVFIGTACALTLCGGGWISVDGVLFRRPRRNRFNDVVAADRRTVVERGATDTRISP